VDEVFSQPSGNVIESTGGFTVEVLGQVGIRYSEGSRSVRMDSEVMTAPKTIVLSKGSIRFWEGDVPGRVSDADRERIAANCKRAFDACGYVLNVSEPLDWDSIAMRRPEERARKRRAFDEGLSRAEYEAFRALGDDPLGAEGDAG
jgi:hypothetical protein